MTAAGSDPLRHYDERYFESMRGHHGVAGDQGPSLYENFLKLAEGLPLGEMRVLDVGCGWGDLLARGVKDLWGLDFARPAVEGSRRLIEERRLPDTETRVLHGSVETPGLFAADRFDLIFMTDVVEHLPQPALEAGLLNVCRWLKPGGRLIIHTFPTRGPHRLSNALLRLRGQHELLEAANAIHCNVQTRALLKDNVARAGLECRRIWLQNDMAVTSSAYQKMGPGALKTMVHLLFAALRLGPVPWLLGAVRLEEYAKPSIYCLASRASGPIRA